MTKPENNVTVPANTRVKVLAVKHAYNSQMVGTVMYATSYTEACPSDGHNYLAVANSKDNGGGHWATAWEVVDTPLSLLSPEDKQAVTDAVLEAAKARGYCEETKNILSDLNLPTEPTTYTTVKFKGSGAIKVTVNGEAVDFEVIERNGVSQDTSDW